MPYKGYAFESPPRAVPPVRGSAAAAAADAKQKATNEQGLKQSWRCVRGKGFLGHIREL